MTFLLIFIQDCLSYRVSLLGIEGGEGILKKKPTTWYTKLRPWQGSRKRNTQINKIMFIFVRVV